ncbi:MAG: hypothetical protein SOW34_14945 [Oliverpabstia sp.]|nr:hypothetical protein [Oliverpabstia sp.]
MKKEELFETIEDIDKKYIEIADTFKTEKKRVIWMKGLAAAACVALILSLTISKSLNSQSFVTVYASEPGSDERLELSDSFSQIAEYSITQSSVPALCFRVDVAYEVSKISANVSGTGKLLKYKVDEDDTWHVTENGSSLNYEGNDSIYWRPTSASDNTTIVLNIYSSGKLKDIVRVVIKPDDSHTGYVAKIN